LFTDQLTAVIHS